MRTSRLLELIIVQLQTQRCLSTPIEQIVLNDLIANVHDAEAQLVRVERQEQPA